MSSDRGGLAAAMRRIAFVLKLTGDRAAQLDAVRAMRGDFEAACAREGVSNFSVWHIQQYLFGYGETENGDMRALDGVLATGTALGSLLALAITGIVGLAVIMLLCRVFHVGEINRLFSAIKRKVLRR